jgi:hypothetical protein
MTISGQVCGSCIKKTRRPRSLPGRRRSCRSSQALSARRAFGPLTIRLVRQRRSTSCTYQPAGRRDRNASARDTSTRGACGRGIRFGRRARSRVVEFIGQSVEHCMPGKAPRFDDLTHWCDSAKIVGQAACSTGSAAGASSICERSFGQSIKRRRPFMSSTREVQLSTQSPSLQ